MTYAVAILGLLMLVFVHELGHFLAAKGVGARATKFYVGFPPALARHKRGETEYGIGVDPARRLREDRRHGAAAAGRPVAHPRRGRRGAAAPHARTTPTS